MIVFIDGPQVVGKSTLIKYLKNYYPFESFKFDFSKYTQIFNIKGKEQLKGYQIGKDFSTLYWLKSLEPNKKLLIDRGPISSIYYSHLYKRMDEKEILSYLDLLKEYNNFNFIFILPKNKKEIKRNKKDGFDSLDSQPYSKETVDFIISEAKKRNIKFHIFYNNFNESIDENGERLKNLILNMSK